jgi:hypothetical protein
VNVHVLFDAIFYYKECYIDLSGAVTGLLILNCNWGSGGWLKTEAVGAAAVCSESAGCEGCVQTGWSKLTLSGGIDHQGFSLPLLAIKLS